MIYSINSLQLLSLIRWSSSFSFPFTAVPPPPPPPPPTNAFILHPRRKNGNFFPPTSPRIPPGDRPARVHLSTTTTAGRRGGGRARTDLFLSSPFDARCTDCEQFFSNRRFFFPFFFCFLVFRNADVSATFFFAARNRYRTE